MKFRKQLEREARRCFDWAPFFVHYKALKQATGRAVDDRKSSRGDPPRDTVAVRFPSTVDAAERITAEELRQLIPAESVPFFNLLADEINKVTRFFEQTCAQIEKRLDTLHSPTSSQEIDEHVIHGCLLIVRKLKAYAETNFVGVMKILKKHDERMQSAVRDIYITEMVARQPFVSNLQSVVLCFSDSICRLADKHEAQLPPLSPDKVSVPRDINNDIATEGRKIAVVPVATRLDNAGRVEVLTIKKRDRGVSLVVTEGRPGEPRSLTAQRSMREWAGVTGSEGNVIGQFARATRCSAVYEAFHFDDVQELAEWPRSDEVSREWILLHHADTHVHDRTHLRILSLLHRHFCNTTGR
eukprot:Plantae.Rhodophyta-Rhodochaete_pulchella.ctg18819.p1 GENE.Plantae.Rhodophyta-Rhodochaete_pulchella.ctg18819~~Plantae.Rhodophyta-Rhodochaete_pulchella.ctg18819.p1  ORF type:complete len:356 (+),score=38.97 Plantae.Rhodophyta-Rhodochaete_pulchella.ctg18819:280-1347(+)